MSPKHSPISRASRSCRHRRRPRHGVETSNSNALDSRIIIEQAKGMLAERAQIDMATAFDHIRAMSRNTNTKLTDLSTHIVAGRVDLNTLTTEFHQH